MSYLYHGTNKDLVIPPLSIFLQNEYKKYKVGELPIKRLNSIIHYNRYGDISNEKKKGNQDVTTALFCLKSFINHNRKTNIKIESISSNVIFIFAAEDIQKGEELLIDYCAHISD